ncbi:response regulator [Hydrogenophaga sp. 2FB]|uniref:response regulator n=1 Tax=Hydrogenophaga sp. 2FB TaxID=2502187 RepID=UPI0010FA35EB|nr:response regulator [Hydrogenophaga sp. 2FB]
MVAAYTVALVGFSQAESSTFESFFRLASRRPPAYLVQDEVMDAQILIVNADNVQAVLLVRDAELPGRVLLVGSSDSGTGWPLQRKPVKLVALLATLDEIVGARRLPPQRRDAAMAPAAAQAEEPFRASQLQGLNASMKLASGQAHTQPPDHPPSVLPGAGADRGFSATVPYGAEGLPALAPAVKGGRRRRSVDTEFPLTRPMPRGASLTAHLPTPAAMPVAARTTPAPVARPGVMRMTDFGGLDEMPSPMPPPPRSTRAPRSRIASDKTAVPEVARGDMLLVAESLVEGRILLKRFKRYGLSVDWSREAAQAVVMLKAHAYRLVVIDRLKGEPDGNQICRLAKQTKGPKGAPVVIMFAPTAGSMDRMKAGLAGSDAYLSRSVGEADLYKVLAHHRLVHLDGFAPTNVGF